MSPHDRMLGRITPAALVLGLSLASCAPKSPANPPAEALASCIGKLDGLAGQEAETQKQCEGIRQHGLSAPLTSGGIGNTIATSDADYQSCINGQLAAPVQLVLPTGRTLTCRKIQQQIACD